jgi:hypothetical protein
MLPSALLLLSFSTKIFAVNFDWERDQLTESEALSNSVFRFGSSEAALRVGCRSVPGDDDWPSDEGWSAFNETLGGVLLKPQPLASVCYAGENYDQRKCEQLKQSWAGKSLQ